jgi:transmembrane 9 superfamily protein 2/4
MELSSVFHIHVHSIKHQFDGKWNDANTRLSTCDPHDSKFVDNSETPQEVEVGKDIIFTYDVRFEVLILFFVVIS